MPFLPISWNQFELTPEDAHKIRQLNELYQNFVQQITILNQYQRKTDKQGRLISEKSDLQMACNVLFESILLKVDELDGSLRQFFEQLKSYIEKQCQNGNTKGYEFTQREIRQALRVSKTSLQRFIQHLLELEYIHQYGHSNRGYRYKVAFWDNNEAFRNQLCQALQEQLNKL